MIPKIRSNLPCPDHAAGKISTANFPDSVLREVLKLDKNHDGFLDATEISTALTLLTKYAKFSGFGGVVSIVCGKSTKARKLRRDIAAAARDDQRRTVLISGESGLEKETIATLIHNLRARRNGHLLYRVYCDVCGLGEIFGTEARPGLFDQLSDRIDSVLFSNLENVSDPADLAELWALFERRAYRSRFHRAERPCAARLLVVCESPPPAAAEGGASALTHIPVAPLRQRAADLPLIAGTVLRRVARRRGLPPMRLSKDALHRVRAYGWPDNLRELSSAVERALYIYAADRRLHPHIPHTITCDHLFTSPAEVGLPCGPAQPRGLTGPAGRCGTRRRAREDLRRCTGG